MSFKATDFQPVFAAFGLTPEGVSIYAFNPVFRVQFQGQDAVLKRTQSALNAPRVVAWTRASQQARVPIVVPLTEPREVQGKMWVIYPFMEGRAYDGSLADIRAAGQLLGQLHALSTTLLSPFTWPDNTPESVQEDIDGLQALQQNGKLTAEVVQRLIHWEQLFDTEVYAPLQAATLPWVDASMDFKANNLVYGPDGQPTLIDPDNGEYAPRIFDLALAALLFHLDLPAPGRLFNRLEWAEFLAGYTQNVTLTNTERTLWPLALRYLLQEWGVWHLIDDVEGWENPVQSAFLQDLAGVKLELFQLSTPAD